MRGRGQVSFCIGKPHHAARPVAGAALTDQVEQFLLLFGGEYLLLGQQMLDDEFLHPLLPGANLFLLGRDGVSIRAVGRDQVN